MYKKVARKLLKVSSIVSLALGVISALSILLIAVAFFVSQKDLNIAKIFIVDIVLIIIAVAIFFFFFGIYELLKHIVLVENELEHIEEEIKGKS
jgi:hypothetical protein